MKTTRVEVPDESVLEHTARVMGENSACGRALKEARERRGKGEDVVIVKVDKALVLVPRADLQAAS